MARSERLAFAAICAAAVGACNAIAGLGEFQDVPCEPCGDGSVEASPDDAFPFPVEATVDAGVDADAADAAEASMDTGIDVEASLPPSPPEGGPSIDYRWARWIMPNGAEAGLPNAASYTFVNAGVHDEITGLTWGNSQNDSAGGCIYPWRLPTRIELVSILDTSRSPVLVNPVFTSSQASAAQASVQPTAYWTSSVTPDGRRWTVNFSQGTVAPFTNGAAVICVQSSDAGPP